MRRLPVAKSPSTLQKLQKLVTMAEKTDKGNEILLAAQQDLLEKVVDAQQQADSKALVDAMARWEAGGELFNPEWQSAGTISGEAGDAVQAIVPKMVEKLSIAFKKAGAAEQEVVGSHSRGQ